MSLFAQEIEICFGHHGDKSWLSTRPGPALLRNVACSYDGLVASNPNSDAGTDGMAQQLDAHGIAAQKS
jgi:hypothetical protein